MSDLIVVNLKVTPQKLADLKEWVVAMRPYQRVGDLTGSGGFGLIESLVMQLEAQMPKPKPLEPTGLGAVVEDAEGDHWVRVALRGSGAWRRPPSDLVAASWTSYDRITAVKVLSEGVIE